MTIDLNKAYLLLADGTLFEGKAAGYEGCSIGEVVFNTGMAGYQEVLTDPSYYGQMVCMTYPLVGNYGINLDDSESKKSWVSGYIMREMCEYPSNFRCKMSLDDYLKEQKVVGLQGIDTRKLTRILRNNGVMNGVITADPEHVDFEKLRAYRVTNAVESTSVQQIERRENPNKKVTVALMDYGMKENIRRCDAVCALHERVAKCELIRHELLDAQGLRQRSIFSDGTVVTVDFASSGYSIE